MTTKEFLSLNTHVQMTTKEFLCLNMHVQMTTKEFHYYPLHELAFLEKKANAHVKPKATTHL